MTTLNLRESQFKDYIAVDIVEDGNIIRTPVYISKNQHQDMKGFDYEENKWFLTRVKFDGDKLLCEDIDDSSPCQGLEFEAMPKDLLDKTQFRF